VRATYRLQLTPEFGFAEAARVVPYLRDLGISHLYLSPVLEARRGSQHGYDGTDPTKVREELGGEEALRRLCGDGLAVILDVVPNHLATSDENPFWRDPELRKQFFDLDLRTGLHRRFFDIGELAGVRQEDEVVFDTTHAKVLELVRDGLVDGLRIDHPDGLANPRQYLDRLARAGVDRIWVEKILEEGEPLRHWPVEGTTGYAFANDVTHLFVEPEAEQAFTGLYGELTGSDATFEEVASAAKLELAATVFEPELRRLYEEQGEPNLAQALASFRVYRTYVEPYEGIVADEDRVEIGRAAVSDTLSRTLLLEHDGAEEFVIRFQQTTGAIMAKGVEDTAFYRYCRLTALNEVGGDPGRFGMTVDDFHRANLSREVGFPHELLATTTHDTKRSGDVRARIVALTHLTDEWAERVRVWPQLEDPNESYLLYQTLVGAWPIERERVDAYMEKALREAKVNTNWIEPDVEHERGVRDFCRSLYDDPRWFAEFEPFAQRVAAEGRRISLAMTLLKLTAPGVPDIYQGDEAELLALVDPDNRRPVDWGSLARSLERRSDAKQELVRRALAVRDQFGGYMPIDAPDDVVAFQRGPEWLVVVPLRASASKAIPRAEGWDDLLAGYPVGLFVRRPSEAPRASSARS
jgi:(1->4)-alpha-D-glucan 1-alpha-D-glucosylmutase